MHLFEPSRPNRRLPIYCALDVADNGAAPEAEVAAWMGFSKTYVQKLERSALAKLRRRAASGADRSTLQPDTRGSRGAIAPKVATTKNRK